MTASRLAREARRCNKPVSAIAREALETYFELAPTSKRKIPFAALGASGHSGTARNIEQELAEAWDIDRDR